MVSGPAVPPWHTYKHRTSCGCPLVTFSHSFGPTMTLLMILKVDATRSRRIQTHDKNHDPILRICISRASSV